MAAPKRTVTLARSAISGQFVKKSYAKAHPSTTEVEHRPAPARSKPRKG